MSRDFRYLKSRETCNSCGEAGNDCRELHKPDGTIINFDRGTNISPDYKIIGPDQTGVFTMCIEQALKDAQDLENRIDYVQPQKIILCPDAGSRANKNVLRQYRAIANLLKSWGDTLWKGTIGSRIADLDHLKLDPNQIAQLDRITSEQEGVL